MAKKESLGRNISDRVSALIKEKIVELGFILWNVEYKKEGSEYNLIVTIDSDDREITIDDCVNVTDAVNPILDEADPISDSYCLEVSSAGLERELTRDFHFEKYLGEEVEVKLFAPHETFGKNFSLPLVSYDSSNLFFRNGEETVSLERSKIASVKTVVDYDKIFGKNKKD